MFQISEPPEEKKEEVNFPCSQSSGWDCRIPMQGVHSISGWGLRSHMQDGTVKRKED